MIRLAVDLALVAVFAAIGRLSHHESLSPSGWAHTAWPFLAGTLAGWAVLAAAQRSPAGLAGGLVVWVATVAVGMVLRSLTGQGVAVSFVVVASVVLGVLLLGSRLVWRA
ncbi:DUF3054 domain-containing protein [Nocardioides sp.]|uniref:DUF3054 domain-containing protein n=1 Tax=Nocardioides sp. TaxID=35761 RepID=UPI003526EEE5